MVLELIFEHARLLGFKGFRKYLSPRKKQKPTRFELALSAKKMVHP